MTGSAGLPETGSCGRRVEHIGIAVRKLDEAVRRYEALLGVACYGIEAVEDQRVNTAFFRLGDVKIELLESASPDSPLGKFLESHGEGLHHIAYRVPDVAEALRQAEAAGFRLIDKEPRRGAEGMLIAFVHPKSTGGVLTEFCQIP
jgi:methylmalonyl-CoA/ethylmalonyl-CoA epimerase